MLQAGERQQCARANAKGMYVQPGARWQEGSAEVVQWGAVRQWRVQ